MPNKVIVHIGFIKTATTTLQEALFARHSQIEFVGRHDKSNDQQKHLFSELHKLATFDSTQYDGQILKEKFYALRISSGGKTIIVSYEGLTHFWATDRGLVANRIMDVFGPCKILAVIRNQKDVIKSFYNKNQRRTYLVMPRKYDNVTFSRWLEYNLLPQHVSTLCLSTVEYYETIKYYANLFGKNNIKILLFEDFIEDKKSFIEELADYCGVSKQESCDLMKDVVENKGFTKREVFEAIFGGLTKKEALEMPWAEWKSYICLKISPRIFGRFFKWDEKATGGLSFGTKEKEIVDLYKDGNKKLSEEYDLPLGKYGYPLPDSDRKPMANRSFACQS